MKEGWTSKPFESCIEKVSIQSKIPSSAYQDKGDYPIVSQEKELISGFWDNAEDVYFHQKPIIVFGDHTMVVKYIDFNFVVGADGVKILNPKPFIEPKYFYYWVLSSHIVSRGYARHYRYLREKEVPIPQSISEQQRIVDFLDKEFAKIDTLKANAEKNFQNAKALFQAVLNKELTENGTKSVRLDEICSITSSLVNPCESQYQGLVHVGGGNIESETGVLFDLKTAKEEKLISGKFLFDESMVLYNKIRPYLKKVAKPNFCGLCSADMYPLKPNRDCDRNYLYYILLSKEFTDYAIMGSARAGMPKVNRDYLFSYTCKIPEVEQQKRIALLLDVLNTKCKVLQDNYTQTVSLCDDLKQSLLRKAFNGEL